MKTTIISDDKEVINMIRNLNIIPDSFLDVYSEEADALKIMTYVVTASPSILIFDDDFLKTQTISLLNSIRKINQKLKIIFLTSNSSLDLGRKLCSVGFYYYAIKPLSKYEISESLKSLIYS